MASGFGTRGSTGRCYPIWKDFTFCVRDADSSQQCNDYFEDYLECLHHQKESGRLKQLNDRVGDVFSQMSLRQMHRLRHEVEYESPKDRDPVKVMFGDSIPREEAEMEYSLLPEEQREGLENVLPHLLKP